MSSNSTFQITLTCACGEVSEFQSVLSRPGGKAPLPCKCGRSYVLQQLDEKDVLRVAVDPTGATGGDVPDDIPQVH